jgi:hypothetical protein
MGRPGHVTLSPLETIRTLIYTIAYRHSSAFPGFVVSKGCLIVRKLDNAMRKDFELV